MHLNNGGHNNKGAATNDEDLSILFYVWERKNKHLAKSQKF